MDAIDRRRKAHIQRLRDGHDKEFNERFVTEKTRAQLNNEKLTDAISADWNRKKKLKEQARMAERSDAHQLPAEKAGEPLPEGWRDEHWKTLQSMAAEYAGAETGDKASSIAALEAYEATLHQETTT